MKEWTTKTLGEVCYLSQGLAINVKTKKYLVPKSDLPLLRIKDLQTKTYEKFIDPNNFPKNCFVDKHELIYTRTGQIGLVFTGFRGILHNNCFKIKPSKELYQDYLAYFIQADSFKEKILKLSSRTTQPDITHKIFNSQKITFPPLKEQKRIAAILDKADAIRRKRKEAIRLTEELLRSTFLDMFGDPVTNPKGWIKKPLGNLCTVIRGGSPRPINDYLGVTIPWIKIGDATAGDQIYIHKTAEAIKEEGVKSSRYLEPGSLIFANCGVSLGFARILRISGCIHDGWLAFSDIDRSLNQIFLLKLLNTITEYFRAIAPDGTQPNLNTTIMKNFMIPVPPINLQEKFAEITNQQISSGQKYSEMLKESENLFNSLLQKAFRGEL